MPLTPDQLSEFRDSGFLVVEDVFSPDEVAAARALFHDHLGKLGIDHDAVLAGKAAIPGYRIKSPVSRIFYPKWKLLDIHLDSRVSTLATDLLVATYGSGVDKNFSHPFGSFSSVLVYIDRVCWRLPDVINEEGGLGLHLDRNPVDPYLWRAKVKGKETGLTKWRPIQSFVCLTDHFDGESGGLKLVPGFHKHIDSFFQSEISDGEGGEFYRLNSNRYHTLQKQCRPVIAPAGSMVFWDNRLPHATAAHLAGCDTREVVYTGFLPNTKLNQEYAAKQLAALKDHQSPPAYEGSANESDCDWDFSLLTAAQKKLLGF